MPNNTWVFGFFGKEQQEAAAVSKNAGAEICGYALITAHGEDHCIEKKVFQVIFL